MVDALMDRAKWAPSTKKPLVKSGSKRGKHYLSASSNIAKLADNEFIGKYDPNSGIISTLNRLYDFRGGLIVEKFLRESLSQNPSLGGVLIQAHGAIREFFRLGTGTQMILEVVADPDFPLDQQLFVIARTKIPRKLAREFLSALEHGWWRSVPLEIRKKVELDIETI